ncbi:MAG: PP2C family protein-serine/threonine phosphatase [Turneriella sp.]
MTSPQIHGIAERYVYRPVLSIYIRLVKSLSLGAVLVMFTLPVFPLLLYYAMLFLAGLSRQPVWHEYRYELKILWPVFALSCLLYVLLAGGFSRFKIASLLPALRRAEPVLRHLTGECTPDELRTLLVDLEKIPGQLTYLSLFVYALQSAAFYVCSYSGLGNFSHITLFLVIDAFVLAIISGLVYSIAEFACSYLRMQVKRQLSAHDEPANEITSGSPGVLRFLYLLFIGGTSIVALIILMLNPATHVLYEAIQFSVITFLICGTLAVIYFYTWSYSLRQISEATYNVAMGGRGHLPMLSNDRELVELAVNFDAATYEINTIRNYLTELVDEKTKTLSDAYEELKRLKLRQDGDYYLTSNLIESLTEMRPESDTVHIDSLIKQYKTFEFMGHTKEIGGDMNAAFTVRLQGEKYTLVVNADAMGKSLQGAGGVLVLGSALRSLVERTQITEGLRNLSPERWLKNSFLELHRLFSSFNGGMMASMICLLIHDASGYTVMINAEHPKGILLRDNQTSFISHHEGLRKLGNTAVKGRLWVDTFMLKRGDVVILGSDGRDDLVVGTDTDGQPVMNEDERRILRIVRSAQGDLPRTYLTLRGSGEIVDDVSLLRIEYAGRERAEQNDLVPTLWTQFAAAREAGARITVLRKILQQDAENLRAWQLLLALHLKNKNLVDAAFISECIIRIRPDRDFYLYTAALLFFKTGNLDKALNFADRLTLRNWRFEPFLTLIGMIHEARQDDTGMREAGLLLTELLPGHAYGTKLLGSG